MMHEYDTMLTKSNTYKDMFNFSSLYMDSNEYAHRKSFNCYNIVSG